MCTRRTPGVQPRARPRRGRHCCPNRSSRARPILTAIDRAPVVAVGTETSTDMFAAGTLPAEARGDDDRELEALGRVHREHVHRIVVGLVGRHVAAVVVVDAQCHPSQVVAERPARLLEPPPRFVEHQPQPPPRGDVSTVADRRGQRVRLPGDLGDELRHRHAVPLADPPAQRRERLQHRWMSDGLIEREVRVPPSTQRDGEPSARHR